jgi:predicted MFS family arabinose efflux permease
VSRIHVTGVHPRGASAPATRRENASFLRLASAWRDLKEGLAYVWNTPRVLAMMWLAFLINLTAFPLSSGLLPYVARTIYRIDEIGLSHLVAAFAVGALIGSILMTLTGGAKNAPRFMIVNILLWYASVLLFTLFESKLAGMAVLVFIGLFQSASMITMAVALLASVGDQFRARVMGVRMLAVYGLPVGLLAGGVLIDSVGFAGTIATYCAIGTLLTALIGYRWRSFIWH